MALYTKRPVPVEAITFDELVAFGIACGARITRGLPDGLPTEFMYKDRQISLKSETATSYWIPTPKGRVAFSKGDMLVSDVAGSLLVFSATRFAQIYKPVDGE